MTDKVFKVLGAMSGTSTDGVDVVALEIDESCSQMTFKGLESVDFSAPFRDLLLKLQNPEHQYGVAEDPFVQLAQARRELSINYANAAKALLKRLNWLPQEIMAFGVHGQTIRHCPQDGYSLQVIDPSLIAQLCQVRVVSDFRSADVAAGGQGAPLVPPFHQAWLNMSHSFSAGKQTAVLNLGGFSNLTLLDESGAVTTGGDCGPANSYLDWCAQHYFGQKYDDQGGLASQGTIEPKLLSELMSHPFFAQAWPGSTGKEDFGESWLRSKIAQFPNVTPENLMMTLVEMAALAVSRCLKMSAGDLYACGGGVRNRVLLDRIQSHLGAGWTVQSTDDLGLPTQAVEAAAFAWLAACFCFQKESNCIVVTGASRSVVLGVSTV